MLHACRNVALSARVCTNTPRQPSHAMLVVPKVPSPSHSVLSACARAPARALSRAPALSPLPRD